MSIQLIPIKEKISRLCPPCFYWECEQHEEMHRLVNPVSRGKIAVKIWHYSVG